MTQPSLFDQPIVRTDDPWTSKLAAERIEPTRGTRKARVLLILQRWRDWSEDGWVAGHVLQQPNIGGSEGLRRLRELRADGYNIERRPDPESKTSWQYRLVE